MVWCDSTEIVENPCKRRRYLIINEEVYAEHPESQNGTKDSLSVQHLVPLSETNYSSCDQIETSVNHEINNECSIPREKCLVVVEENNLGATSSHESSLSETDSHVLIIDETESINEDTIVVSDDEDLESDPRTLSTEQIRQSLPLENSSEKDEHDFIGVLDPLSFENGALRNLSVSQESVPSNLEDESSSRKRLRKESNGMKSQAEDGVLYYVRDGDVRIRVSDHFPIIKFSEKNVSPAYNLDIGLEECPYCNWKVHKKKISRHLFQHLIPCFCTGCNTAVTFSKIRSHQFHGGLKCFKCSFTGDDEPKFRAHLMNSHKDFILRQCSICGCLLEKCESHESQLKLLVKHIKDNHCRGKLAASTWNFFMATNNIHRDFQMFRCLDCPSIVAPSLTNLLNHVSEHYSQEIFKCKFCKFSHSSDTWIKLHEQTHSKSMFKCPYCKHKVSEHYRLKYHIRNEHKK